VRVNRRLILAALPLHAAITGQALGGGCSELDLKALDIMEQVVARGDAAAIVDTARGPNRCAALNLARLSLLAYHEARAVAALGGPVERQGPVRRALASLNDLRGGSLDLEVEYADTAIRAAIAAAQDERPEMELLLTHARDLAERLSDRSRRAVWPRPFNLLAGELWLEVDRFEEARAAFERAVKADAGPVAIVGLARALARLGRHEEACRLWRRVPDDAQTLREATRQDFAECR
jgi:tetratricopeptide (TPR) repeat protein